MFCQFQLVVIFLRASTKKIKKKMFFKHKKSLFFKNLLFKKNFASILGGNCARGARRCYSKNLNEEELEKIKEIEKALIESSNKKKREMENIQERFKLEDSEMDLILNSTENRIKKLLRGGFIGCGAGLTLHFLESSFLELTPILNHPFIFGVFNALIFSMIGGRIADYLSIKDKIRNLHSTQLFTVIVNDFYDWSNFTEEKLSQISEKDFQEHIYSLKEAIIEIGEKSMIGNYYFVSHFTVLFNSNFILQKMKESNFSKEKFREISLKILKDKDEKAISTIRNGMLFQSLILLLFLSFFSFDTKEIFLYINFLLFGQTESDQSDQTPNSQK